MSQVVSSRKIAVGLLFAVLLWSTEFVGVSQALHDFSPGALAFGRYLFTSLFMLVVYSRQKKRTRPTLRECLIFWLLGAIGIAGYSIGLNFGELTVSSGTASFVVSQMPIVMAILGLVFLGERITPLMTAGMLLGCVGIVLISYDGLDLYHFERGLLYVIFATLGACIYSVMQKPFLERYSAIEFTAFMVWGGTLTMGLFYLPATFRELPQAHWDGLISLIYLGIFPAGVAYLIWAYAIARYPVAKAGSYLYLSPLIATVLAFLYLGEVPRPLALLGGAIALLGAMLVNIRPRRQFQAQPVE